MNTACAVLATFCAALFAACAVLMGSLIRVCRERDQAEARHEQLQQHYSDLLNRLEPRPFSRN